jgi:hypothetical protein
VIVCVTSRYQDSIKDKSGNNINIAEYNEGDHYIINSGSWELSNEMTDPELKCFLRIFITSGVFCRRLCIEKTTSFCEKSKLGEDIYLWLIFCVNFKIYRNSQALLWYHNNNTGLTSIPLAKKPLDAFLLYSDEIRNYCPAEKTDVLERWFTLTALQNAHERLSVRNIIETKYLIKMFPRMKQYKISFLKLKIKMFPGLNIIYYLYVLLKFNIKLRFK